VADEKKSGSMYKRYQDKAKVAVYLAHDVKEYIVQMANDYGMSHSSVTALFISLGIQQFKRVHSPEQLLTPEVWANIAKGNKMLEDIGES
jgi:hypothetical protein